MAQQLTGGVGNDAGNGGFANAGRTVKYQIGNAAAVYYPTKHSTFCQKMALTENLIEGGGAQRIGKRRIVHLSFLPFEE